MAIEDEFGRINMDYFISECKKYNVDPKKITPFTLECLQQGLDPGTASLFLLECTKYKLDPKTASITDLRKAGSTKFDYEDEVK